jgi:hypothetical protein
MKAAMQWFPFLDLVGNRLPNRFIQPGAPDAHRFIAQIEDLARGMGNHDALVIFPEGGNFSERRRIASIGKLFDLGEVDRAREAKSSSTDRSPAGRRERRRSRRAGGQPVFVAHTGLDSLSNLKALWRSVRSSDRSSHDTGACPARRSRPTMTGSSTALRLVGTHRRLDRRAPRANLPASTPGP